MDDELRKALRSVVAECREELRDDVRLQLEGTYGVTPSGEFLAQEDVAPYAVDPRDWVREREEILAAIGHIESYGVDRARAVEQFVRESAFTVLNRLAALKLMEHPTRALIPESVGRGKESKGFLLFQKISPEVCRAARNGAALDGGYRLFLESIFDDVAEELGVLFDRRLPQSIIFPSDACLKRVLEVLNQNDIAAVWGEDETIGWIYQYFIPKELRDEARKASQAPQNSYELAFRNQFYTPRYVVEFLVDNTLGRVWYEMQEGDTCLAASCKYLVRGTTDVFVEPSGALLPSEAAAAAAFGRPNHIARRTKKDPRDLQMLDPACGSGHFLLYAYDLLETIYFEALDDPESPPSRKTARRLRDDYPDREALRRAIPELIVRHNLHGIDIDLRATQIAALALWLRVQRSYQEQGFKVASRPRITHSNIVCAEPMPGERELLEEFIATLQPKLLGQLVRVVFDRMVLAGEAGSLLPIEEEIRGAVAEAKRQWQAGPQPEQLMLFPAERRRVEQLALFDIRGITDESFWQEAEGRVIESLLEYARKAANGRSYRRRLFVEDTTQGFAFIDLVRKRFDVVLMNPPFGAPCASTNPLIPEAAAGNIYAAFVLRARTLATALVGVVSDRTFTTQASFETFRKVLLSPEMGLDVLADLGWEILDANVQVAAYTLRAQSPPAAKCIDVRSADAPAEALRAIVSSGESVDRQALLRLPNSVLAYALPRQVLRVVLSGPFVADRAKLPRGLGSNDAQRTYRFWVEVPASELGPEGRWQPLANGGDYSPYCRPDLGVALWRTKTGDLCVSSARPGEKKLYDQSRTDDYFRPGLSFPKQSSVLNVAILPRGLLPTREGKAILPNEFDDAWFLLGYLNSSPVRAYVRDTCGLHKQSGAIGRVPIAPMTADQARKIGDAAKAIWRALFESYRFDETTRWFELPAALESGRAANDIYGQLTTIDRIVCEAFGLPADSTWIDAQDAPTTFDESPTDMASWAVGVAFGRFDLRLPINGKSPVTVDAFARPPEIPPGMLPPGVASSDCPIDVPEDGILVEDDGDPADVVRRVSRVLECVWRDEYDARVRELVRDLGVDSLREYYAQRFFDDHVRRYSKARRKAPIYWLLRSARRSYGLWIYYPRLDRDTVFKALRNYVEPKLKGETARLKEMRQRLDEGRETLARRERSKLEKDIERQDALLGELGAFKEGLARVGALGYEPDLDDGVVLNIAAFHELTPWKEARAYWGELLEGKYAWSTIAKRLREREVAGTSPGKSARHG